MVDLTLFFLHLWLLLVLSLTSGWQCYRYTFLALNFINLSTKFKSSNKSSNININTINRYLLKNFKVDFTFLNTVNSKNMIKRSLPEISHRALKIPDDSHQLPLQEFLLPTD